MDVVVDVSVEVVPMQLLWMVVDDAMVMAMVMVVQQMQYELHNSKDAVVVVLDDAVS